MLEDRGKFPRLLHHSTDRLFGDYFREDMIVDGQSLRLDQEGIDINATEVT